VIFWEDSSGLEHVVIVENIKYDNGRVVTDSNIEVIHQTTYYGKWYVQKSKYNKTSYYPGGGNEHTPTYIIIRNGYLNGEKHLKPTYKRIK
jgi:hypothetical protein